MASRNSTILFWGERSGGTPTSCFAVHVGTRVMSQRLVSLKVLRYRVTSMETGVGVEVSAAPEKESLYASVEF